jgi:lysophospholipase L1-like esterase
MASERSRRVWWAWSVLALVGLAIGWTVYRRVASAELNLTTGLLLIAVAWVGLFLLAELASMAGPLAAYRHRLRLLVVTVGVLAVGSELLLRSYVPQLRTYFEHSGETTYRSLSHHTGPTWFHVHPANHDLTWTTADFVHARRTNDLGLSERSIPLEKKDREFRIVALGDSGTEGVGTDYESTWVKVLERRLADQLPDRIVTALNAGISGSDVFFEYTLLKEKLVNYAPDLVIVAVNTTDVEDVMLRGGMERFQPDGTFRSPHAPPSWEWLYGVSFMTRLVVHGGLGYDRLFIKRRRQEVAQRQAVEKIRSLIPAFGELASKHRFRSVIVFHPTSGDVANQRYAYDFQSLIAGLRQRPGIDVIDVLARWSAASDASADRWLRWYWPTDGHHNIQGYAVLGATIGDGLIELGLPDETPLGSPNAM